MKKKMKILQIVQKTQEDEIKKMKKEDILVEECMEKMKKNLISNKSKQTREENKNKHSVRKSKRLIEKSLKNDDIEYHNLELQVDALVWWGVCLSEKLWLSSD